MNFAALTALIILLCVALGAQELRILLLPLDTPEHTMTLMSIAVMLVGGWLTGMVFHSLKLPRICGYLAFGVLIGPSPYTLGLLPSADHVRDDLGFISDLAISLIAITAGGEIRFDWLRGQLKRIITLVSVEVSIILAGSFLIFLFGLPHFSFLADASSTTIACAAGLSAIVVIANSPTVAIAMISDYRARGPLSQTTLSLTIAKDILLIAMFTTALVVTKTLLDEGAKFSLEFLLAIAVQLLGSIALGSLAGMLMAIYVQRIKAHLGLFIIGCCMLFALAGKEDLVVGITPFHLEPLLMALSAGVVMQNYFPDKSTFLFHRLEELSLPVYCLFFSLAGAKIDLVIMRDLWYFAAGLAVIRAFIIWFGTKAATAVAGINEPWRNLLWFGLIPQAGVSLVLVTIIAQKFSGETWTAPLTNLLIGMIVCNELFGPIGFRYALYKSGEAQDDSR